MIMATEKRKSAGGPAAGGTPSKFQKNQQGGKSPMGGGGKPGTPKHQKTPNKPNQKPTTPPPPPKGAKQLKVEVKQVQENKKGGQNQKQGGGKPFQKKGGSANGALNKVSEQSKNINKKNKKKGARISGQKRAFNKLDIKPRDKAQCERALQAEIDLGHTGRVFTVKLPDPVINSEVVKAWSTSIETSVFPKPVEPRQLFVVFKNNVDVKKEVEKLKKVSFGGGKLQVEERVEGENIKLADQIDPFSLYLSNVHESTTKEELQKLFKKASSVSTPKKHGPRVKSQTKFAFVIYENADDALAAFKENYTAVLHGNTLVMRFRRIATRELHQQQNKEKKIAAAAAAVAETKAAASPAKKQTPAPAKPVKKDLVKKEQESDEDDDEDDEEDEGLAGLKMDEDDSEEDDEDDDDEEGEEEEDEDDDEEDDDEDDDEDEDDE